MQVKSILTKQKTNDDMSFGWSDTFSKEEENLKKDINVSTTITTESEEEDDDDEYYRETLKDKYFYNRTYVKLQFKELIIKLANVLEKEDSVFLKGINFAELVNKNFYIYKQYPIERQVLTLSKFAVSTIMKTESTDDYDFLLQRLAELSERDLHEKEFRNFRQALIQKKLIYFRSSNDK